METTNLEISATDVKKELYKNKTIMANFSHFENGKLYYTVELESGTYQFPLNVIEKVSVEDLDNTVYTLDEWGNKVRATNDNSFLYQENPEYNPETDNATEAYKTAEFEQSAADLKGASFDSSVKGSELNRWVGKAIKNEEFIKIG